MKNLCSDEEFSYFFFVPLFFVRSYRRECQKMFSEFVKMIFGILLCTQLAFLEVHIRPQHISTAQSIPVPKTNRYFPKHTGTAQRIPVLSRVYWYCPIG